MLPRKASRSGRTSLIALRALALAFLGSASVAVGCGDAGEDADSEGGFDAGDSALTVTLDPDGAGGGAKEMTEEVSCPGASEDAACRAVAAMKVGALAPTPADTACTELFGGPDTASLKGTVRGEDLNVDLTRSNGCEIARFDAALPLLQALFPGYEPGASLAPDAN